MSESHSSSPGGGEVIDLRSLNTTQLVDGGDGVIDLREDARLIRPRADPTMSGRPSELLDGFQVVTIMGGDLWLAAEAFVYDVYRTAGFCDPSPRQRVEELQRWSDQSHFIAVIDTEGAIAGTVRIIEGPFDELPIGSFECASGVRTELTCELSSLAVEKNLRGTGVIEHLYRAGWLRAFRSPAETLVGVVDPWLYDIFRDHYGLPFSQIGQARFYMGADVLPVAMPLDGPAYDDLARRNPEFWRWTLEGVDSDELRGWDLPRLPVAVATADVTDLANLRR